PPAAVATAPGKRHSPGGSAAERGTTPGGHERHQGRRCSDHPNNDAPDGGETGSVVSVRGTVGARGTFGRRLRLSSRALAAGGLRPLLAQEPLAGREPVVD